MRRTLTMLAAIAVLMALAVPANASAVVLEDPINFWLSDPDGVDGDNGIEQGDVIANGHGRAVIRHDRAAIRIETEGLVPGHVYTVWVVYFNDKTLCVDGCNGPDFGVAGGGVIFGDGEVAALDGSVSFFVDLRNGAGAEFDATPPPPFAHASYEASLNNEFHIAIRSHGPQIDGLVDEQLTSYGGGCEVDVGPTPGEVGDFPVPSAPGECGEVQLYIFG